MYLLRVALPDRPGSLGAVASALGSVQADISAVEIVEKGAGRVIDDFMLDIPGDVRPDALITACTRVPGVEVLWVSFYPENWGLNSDLDMLEAMAEDPRHAEQVLADSAPTTFHCSWGLVLEHASGVVHHRSALAPQQATIPDGVFGDLRTPHVGELDSGWLDGWSAHSVAVTPCCSDHTVVVGRPGPEFRASELARLRHLAQIAGEHLAGRT